MRGDPARAIAEQVLPVLEAHAFCIEQDHSLSGLRNLTISRS